MRSFAGYLTQPLNDIKLKGADRKAAADKVGNTHRVQSEAGGASDRSYCRLTGLR